MLLLLSATAVLSARRVLRLPPRCTLAQPAASLCCWHPGLTPALNHPHPMVPIQVPSAWPALVRTGSQMAQYGTTLALVGGTFATVDVSGSQ